jgi:hypothetical protein
MEMTMLSTEALMVDLAPVTAVRIHTTLGGERGHLLPHHIFSQESNSVWLSPVCPARNQSYSDSLFLTFWLNFRLTDFNYDRSHDGFDGQNNTIFMLASRKNAFHAGERPRHNSDRIAIV